MIAEATILCVVFLLLYFLCRGAGYAVDNGCAPLLIVILLAFVLLIGYCGQAEQVLWGLIRQW